METKKNKEKFVCEICDFSTSYKQNYLKHLSTAKHRRLSFGNKKELGEFYCEACDYTAVTKQNFNKHLATDVHLETKKNALLICGFCNKKFKTRAGLWKHKNKCREKNKNSDSKTENVDNNNKNLVKDFYQTELLQDH